MGGNCVSCIIKIHNNMNKYLLKPHRNNFKWGYLKYETEDNDVMYPKNVSIKGVQGRENSMSGVQGSFTFYVVNQNNNYELGRIKLFFDIPYDTNIHSRSANFKIINDDNNVNIKINTVEDWGGYGYGDENLCKFFITD